MGKTRKVTRNELRNAARLFSHSVVACWREARHFEGVKLIHLGFDSKAMQKQKATDAISVAELGFSFKSRLSGEFKIEISNHGLKCIELGELNYDPSRSLQATSSVRWISGESNFRKLPDWVIHMFDEFQYYLRGQEPVFSHVSLFSDKNLGEFTFSVYEACSKIPAGQTQSYGELAYHLGMAAGASRAVGGALGRNPWPLLVPCHRVIGANGALTGFSAGGGLLTKQALLAFEKDHFFAHNGKHGNLV